MEFQLFHNRYFNAKNGSYSIVTNREEYDSQITLTDTEAEMVINYFGINNIQLGNVASDKVKASKTFFLYPNLLPIKLNLVFPKPNKHELRLYISRQAGFKPASGQIWFLYIDVNNQLIIGALDQSLWNDLDQIDIEDEAYLEEIQDKIIKSEIITQPPLPTITKITTGSRTTYKRNGIIASFALAKAKYLCEIDENHKTFISQRTNLPYTESHHFVPMKFQDDFPFPLDCTENIISLCPTCHRGFHYGVTEHKKGLIGKIYDSRSALNNFAIEDMFSFYNSLKLA
jgi:5-methylcytosine-specific restriction enzyme A